MRGAIVVSVLLIGVSQSSSGQTKTVEEIKFNKVTLMTTKAEFLKLHPKASKETHEDAKFGMSCYMVGDLRESVCKYCFLGEKMVDMCITYSPQFLDRQGGWQTVYKYLTTNYGEVRDASPKYLAKSSLFLAYWKNEETDNVMGFDVTRSDGDNILTMLVWSKSLTDEVNTLKFKNRKGGIE